MQFVLSFHSLLRWLILFFALVTLINSVTGMSGKKPFTGGHKRTALFLMICCDIQLLLGLILYFMGPWWGMLKSGTAMSDKVARYFTVEHSVGMIVAIILIHLGYSATKKNIADSSKFKRLFWFILFAIIIILGTIPWPSRDMIGRPLFRGM
jgi:hypothetical protein